MYSLTGKPARQWQSNVDLLGMPMFIPVVAAFGAVRTEQHHASRGSLKTVPLDYYAASQDDE
jgi:hypothetical protein